MLLAIDIGNTNIVLGIYHNQQWLKHWRVQTVKHRMPDEYAVIFLHLFQEISLSFTDFKRIIISSVVPQLTPDMIELFQSRTKITPLIVNHKTDTGIVLKTNPPEGAGTGSDLIANAVAAYHRLQQNCLVIDFGTATTIMAVQQPGILLGGAIAPGIATSLDALVSKTSQLPQIAFVAPQTAIGNNSIAAMQSGLVLGHLSLIEGLITRMKQEIAEPKVIATGGHARMLAHLSNCIDIVDPWLTLEGLKIIAERN
jgi:type III pantothenate kinase